MSAMILLETPHLNILSKMDLIKDQVSKRQLKRFLDPDPLLLLEGDSAQESESNPRFHDLNVAISQLIDDFGMVQYLPLEAKNPDSVATILSYIDDVTQWAEAQEPKEPKDEEIGEDIDLE